MAEKKIIVNISDKGKIDAETFDMSGMECIEELDKLLKGLALESTTTKKEDFFKNSTKIENSIKVKK